MDYKEISAITTFCMNEEYIKKSLATFLDTYPEIIPIVVDNSDEGSSCDRILNNLWAYGQIRLISNGNNLGHGYGLTQGMEKVKTKYVLIFDSDVIFFNRDLIPDMMAMMDSDTYGVGFVMWLGIDGDPVRPHHIHEERPKNSMKYLHPFCALISVEQYKQYKPFDTFVVKHNKTHGSPMLSAMRSIYNAGDEYKIKKLPDSSYTKCKYWNHMSGGARIVLRKMGRCP
jgi:GT2 family glycosyltransferase